MPGFRSPEHQGHTAARTGVSDEKNPYPRTSQDFYRYQNGCNAARRGASIDRRGEIVEKPGG